MSASSAKISPKPQKETVYLEAEDDITSIIEKVESAEQKVVALVLPKRMTSLQSIVNMRLLKRNADKANKSVVLITSDASLLPLAGAAKLHVAKNLQSKPEIPETPDGAVESSDKEAELPEGLEDGEETPAKLDYHRSVGELAAVHAMTDGDDETIDLADDENDASDDKAVAGEKLSTNSKGKKIKVPNFDKFRMSLGVGGMAIVALIAFLVLALVVWPRAAITISTESIPVTAEFSLHGSDSAKELDMEKKIIPVATKTSEQTATVQVTATGQQNNGEKATGSVTLTNCTNNATTVPAGTGISTNGLTYITQKSVSLDSGNFTGGGICKSTGSHVGSTNISAQQGGSKYNTSISGASVAGFAGVTASGSASGGTDNITTVVSQSDVDSAKSKITSDDTDTFTKKFEDDLAAQGLYVLPSTLKVSEPASTANPAVGQPASNTTVTTKITYTVFAVTKADLSKAISSELEKQIDPKKQKLSDDDVIKGADISVQNPTSPNDLVININQTASAIPIIDTESIKKQVGGKKTSEIKAAISPVQGVKSVDVKMSPFWVSKAPKKPNKVTVVVIPVKKSSGSNTSNEP